MECKKKHKKPIIGNEKRIEFDESFAPILH